MPLGRGLTGRHVLVVMKSGANWGVMTRGGRLRQTFDNDMKFIEIGPSHYPVVCSRHTQDVLYDYSAYYADRGGNGLISPLTKSLRHDRLR